MPKYEVYFVIETDNEPSDELLNNGLLAGIRLARPIFAQHGTKITSDDYDLAITKAEPRWEEPKTDDAQRDSSAEGTSAPSAPADNAPDAKQTPAT